MDCNKYLAIRHAYNLIRQDDDPKQRMTFAEFAVLCHLIDTGIQLAVSQIAIYQSSLYPTMTYRTKKLRLLGYMRSTPGEQDRRKIVCEVTKAGQERVEELCKLCSKLTKKWTIPLHLSAERMRYYVDGMGTLDCNASDLVLLATKIMESDGYIMSDIGDLVGLMQPTVSMTVMDMEKKGLLKRIPSTKDVRGNRIILTEDGQKRVEELMGDIADIIVPRKSALKAS